MRLTAEWFWHDVKGLPMIDLVSSRDTSGLRQTLLSDETFDLLAGGQTPGERSEPLELLAASNPVQETLAPLKNVPNIPESWWTIDRKGLVPGGLGDSVLSSGPWFFLRPGTPHPWRPNLVEPNEKFATRPPNAADVRTRVGLQHTIGTAMIAGHLPLAASMLREYVSPTQTPKTVQVPSAFYLHPNVKPRYATNMTNVDIGVGMQGVARAAAEYFRLNPGETSVQVHTPWRAARNNWPADNTDQNLREVTDQNSALGSYYFSFSARVDKKPDGSLRVTNGQVNVFDRWDVRNVDARVGVSVPSILGTLSQRDLWNLQEAGLARPFNVEGRLNVDDFTVTKGKMPEKITYRDGYATRGTKSLDPAAETDETRQTVSVPLADQSDVSGLASLASSLWAQDGAPGSRLP
jgi:hypothetical protein